MFKEIEEKFKEMFKETEDKFKKMLNETEDKLGRQISSGEKSVNNLNEDFKNFKANMEIHNNGLVFERLKNSI